MHRIAYLLLGVALLIVYAVIYASRPDLRRTLLAAGVMGGIAGPISELWYLRDYWRPETILSFGFAAPEDVLFGGAVTGVAATVVLWWTGKRAATVTAGHPWLFLAMLPASTAILILFANLFGWQSILVSSAMFLCGAGVMLVLRPDLLHLSVGSGIGTVLVVIPVYVLLFGIVAAGYWERHWLWAGTPEGVYILPGVPWTEVIWYFSWGALAGIARHFIRGTAPRSTVR